MLKSALSSLCLGSLILLTQGCQDKNQASFGPLEYTAPIETSGDLVQIPVSINGASPELFVLDTGLVGMIISEDYAALSDAQKTGETVTVTGSGGQATQTMDIAKNLLMDLEGLQWPIQKARIAANSTIDPIREMTGHPFHGMVGSFLFETYVVKIDFQAEMLTLYPPQSFQYSGDGITLPLVLRNRKPHINIEIQQHPNSSPKRAIVLLDLGSSRSLDLRGSRLSPSPQLPQRHLLGFGGESLHPTGRIHRLTLGTHNVSNAITTFESSHSQTAQNISGRIGNQILSQFNVILNYPKKQVIFEPIASPLPQQVDMSGLRLKQDLEDDSIVVADVYPDSPAQEVGIQPGDRLTQIERQPLGTLSLADVRQTLIDKPQSIREITVQREKQQLTFTLKLRQLI